MTQHGALIKDTAPAAPGERRRPSTEPREFKRPPCTLSNPPTEGTQRLSATGTAAQILAMTKTKKGLSEFFHVDFVSDLF